MDDVTTEVEQTTETTPSVVETNDTEVQAAPVESIDTVEEVSKTVPYDRFKEVNDKYRSLESQVAQIIQNQTVQQSQYQEELVDLDPSVVPAVQKLINQQLGEIKAAEFRAKHMDELESNEVLKAQTDYEMRKQASQGKLVDPELALKAARQSLESMTKPQIEQAQKAALAEGQDIAKTKQQLGAVGEAGKTPEVAEKDLSAAELAKLYNIPRAE